MGNPATQLFGQKLEGLFPKDVFLAVKFGLREQAFDRDQERIGALGKSDLIKTFDIQKPHEDNRSNTLTEFCNYLNTYQGATFMSSV